MTDAWSAKDFWVRIPDLSSPDTNQTCALVLCHEGRRAALVVGDLQVTDLLGATLAVVGHGGWVTHGHDAVELRFFVVVAVDLPGTVLGLDLRLVKLVGLLLVGGLVAVRETRD